MQIFNICTTVFIFAPRTFKGEDMAKVALRKSQINDLYNATPDKSVLTSEWLSAEMYKLLHPVVKNQEGVSSFFEDFDYFLETRKLSDVRTRPVVVYNPTTSEQEIRPLNEVASSHLARRCFVGNLYKQVKDPNLVGALSGHKEGLRCKSMCFDK